LLPLSLDVLVTLVTGVRPFFTSFPPVVVPSLPFFLSSLAATCAALRRAALSGRVSFPIFETCDQM
ncbi:hypothetical protein PENTCL1PPCAC_30241, partial [Pristionchus entomophagus]